MMESDMSTRSQRSLTRATLVSTLFAFVLLGAACATNQAQRDKDEQFFTSGSQEADRRADQRVPNEEGEGGPAQGASAPAESATAKGAELPIEPDVKSTLYERLGGEAGVRRIVDDFVERALEDPRVNWSRKGVTFGGWFRPDKSVEWNATPANIKELKEHFVQFISVAAGGPAEYKGRPIKSVHAKMQITESEFEAAIGDLKATLDRLQVAPEIQKELLAVFESARAQVVVNE